MNQKTRTQPLVLPTQKNTAAGTIVLFSPRELEKMRRVGKLASQLLDHLALLIAPGVSTWDLDAEAERWTQAHGAKSAPLGYNPSGSHPFPASICTSVNQVVCHGIPNRKQILRNGDLINIDVTPILEGYHGDTSRTFAVGELSTAATKLVTVAEASLWQGIAAVRPGGRIGDIGHAIQTYAESHGFAVVRDLVGHGVGRQFHMDPVIPHYGEAGKGLKLRPGMVFTIEPMINQGSWEVEFLSDHWTVVTRDRKLSAQFEHTVAVTETGVEVLTLGGSPNPFPTSP